MPREKILVVDDDEDILELMRFNLAREGYRVSCAASGEQALEMLEPEPPDLILLDLMLPGIDGIEVARRIKHGADTRNLPIVMVTAKDQEPDVVVGLEIGADDYITKPFSPRVLVARIKAVLRRRERASADSKSVIGIGDMVIHLGRREVTIKGRPVNLTYTEFGILEQLAMRPEWVLGRSELVAALRGGQYPVGDRSVDTHILGLRKKLGPEGRRIETVRGVGYRLKSE
jgi:two-component system phosphate regulon response regulator PhoB